jgi:hypothetical protein
MKTTIHNPQHKSRRARPRVLRKVATAAALAASLAAMTPNGGCANT